MPLAQTRLEVLQIRKLIQCVREHDVTQIEKIAELGIAGVLDYQDPDTGESAQHIAASLNHDTVVMKLLSLGASTTLQDKDGLTPAMVASKYGHVQSLQQLAVGGLALSAVDLQGKPVTFHCLNETQRHARCLEFILQSCTENISRILVDQAGSPLLCAICEGGYVKLLDKMLFEPRLDVNAGDPIKAGRTAVVAAAEGGHHECVKMLMESGANADLTYGEAGLCALHRAASFGHFEVIQTLSAYGADFSVTTSNGENALHFATKASQMLCIRMLAQRGCPAGQATTKEGLTPQRIAKKEGLKDAMKELKKQNTFQNKCTLDIKPKGFAEPWAVKLFDWLVVNKGLVKDTLRTCDTEKTGSLPVDSFMACMSELHIPLNEKSKPELLAIYDKKGLGTINYIELLSEHKYVPIQYRLGPGENIKAKKAKKKKIGGKGSKGGKTKVLFPIYYEQEQPPVSGVASNVIEKEIYMTDFQRFGREDVLSHEFVDDSPWYLPYPEKQYMLLYEAIRHGDMESILTAMAKGLSKDCRDKFNKTPLMVAASHGKVDVARFLLERGAEVNAYDNFHWTALHHACHSGEIELVKLLLEFNAAVDMQGINGGTPLMRAIQSSQKEMILLLLEKGAKVTTVNKHGDTALDVAKNWGDDFIYATMYAKMASLPCPPEKKGKEKAKGKDSNKGGKKKVKMNTDDTLPKILPGPPLKPLPPPPRLPTPAECMESARRRATLSAMQTSTQIKPSPTYRPRPTWVARPETSESYLRGRSKARKERGLPNIDFGELCSPFQLQMLARVKALEISDA